jgi:hypothetical protein
VSNSKLLEARNDRRHGIVVGSDSARLGVAVLEGDLKRSARRSRIPHGEYLLNSNEIQVQQQD